MSDFYLDLENKFRGARELITERLKIYLPVVNLLKSGNSEDFTSIDLGCGRGEWLELMSQNDIRCEGVDLDETMIEFCSKHGLQVSSSDALEYLTNLANDSLGMVTAFHIVEHLEHNYLTRFLEEVYRVLKPGGLVIFETPNPENIIVGGCNFYLDPSHINPIPPIRLQFEVERIGFEPARILRLQAEAGVLLKELKLYDVLTGVSPDYAIIALKQPSEKMLASFDTFIARNVGVTLEELSNSYSKLQMQKMSEIRGSSDVAKSKIVELGEKQASMEGVYGAHQKEIEYLQIKYNHLHDLQASKFDAVDKKIIVTAGELALDIGEINKSNASEKAALLSRLSRSEKNLKGFSQKFESMDTQLLKNEQNISKLEELNSDLLPAIDELERGQQENFQLLSKKIEKGINSTAAKTATLNTNIIANKDEIVVLKHQYEEMKSNIEALDAIGKLEVELATVTNKLYETERALVEAEVTNQKHTEALGKLNKSLNQKNAEVSGVTNRLIETEKALIESDVTNQKHTQTLEELNRGLSQKNAEVSGVTERLNETERALIRSEVTNEKSTETLEQLNKDLNQRNAEVSEFTKRLLENEKALVESRVTNQKSTESLERLNRHLSEKNTEVSELNTELQHQVLENENLNFQIESLKKSVSWRITSPIRGLIEVCRFIVKCFIFLVTYPFLAILKLLIKVFLKNEPRAKKFNEFLKRRAPYLQSKIRELAIRKKLKVEGNVILPVAPVAPVAPIAPTESLEANPVVDNSTHTTKLFIPSLSRLSPKVNKEIEKAMPTSTITNQSESRQSFSWDAYLFDASLQTRERKNIELFTRKVTKGTSK